MNSRFSMMKSIAVAVAVAAGLSGIARADDSSTNPFTGDSYAALRYGPTAVHDDTTLERASSLWRLKRAIDLLPAPAALRGMPAAQK